MFRHCGQPLRNDFVDRAQSSLVMVVNLETSIFASTDDDHVFRSGGALNDDFDVSNLAFDRTIEEDLAKHIGSRVERSFTACIKLKSDSGLGMLSVVRSEEAYGSWLW